MSRSYLWTAGKDITNNWSSQLDTQLKHWVVKGKPQKNSGLNGIRTHDLWFEPEPVSNPWASVTCKAGRDRQFTRNSDYFVSNKGNTTGSLPLGNLKELHYFHSLWQILTTSTLDWPVCSEGRKMGQMLEQSAINNNRYVFSVMVTWRVETTNVIRAYNMQTWHPIRRKQIDMTTTYLSNVAT